MLNKISEYELGKYYKYVDIYFLVDAHMDSYVYDGLTGWTSIINEAKTTSFKH